MSEQERKGAPDGAARKKRFVLVVDNSRRDANYTAMLLQNFGYNSSVVGSGEEALQFIAITAPALAVTELVLPGMNGLDLFERVVRNPSMAAIPVIIQTRIEDVATEDRCRRAGCAGCLNKPVQAIELYRAVQQAIEPTPRLSIRVPVFFPATIDGKFSGTEFVTELSDGGLYVRSHEPRPVGSKHTVALLLDDRVVRVDAVVLYAYRLENGSRKEPGMGMKFLNLSPVDKDVIQAYIREQVSPGITPDDRR